MTCVGKTFYVGGYFLNISEEEPASHVAMWDGKEWSEVGKKGLDNDVLSLANDGTNVYAAGSFFQIWRRRGDERDCEMGRHKVV